MRTFRTQRNRHSELNMKQKKNKITAREVSETEMSNVPDREFEVMVIKILTGLEKRVEGLSETLNKGTEKTKKNQSEMKNSINEIKNALDGMNSTLEEAEEWIHDLKHREMESIQAEQD